MHSIFLEVPFTFQSMVLATCPSFLTRLVGEEIVDNFGLSLALKGVHFGGVELRAAQW